MTRFLICLLFLTAYSIPAATLSYTWQPLGSVDARRINNRGWVVGTAYPTGDLSPFLYRPGIGIELLSEKWGFATDVTDSGVVVGLVGTDSGSVVAIWEQPGQPAREIRGLQGTPYGINDAGHLAGESSDGQPFLYTPGQGTTVLAVSGMAESINESGQVVGWLRDDPLDDIAKAFVYTPGVGIIRFGSGAESSEARDINEAGYIAGLILGPDMYRDDAVALGFLGAPDGSIVPFGDPDYWTTSWGMNNSNWIVGSYSPRVSGAGSRAFLWTPETGLQDLTEMISGSGPDAQLWTAWDINDRGQIIATGVLDGHHQAFLLAPVPEPGTAILFLIGLLACMPGRRFAGNGCVPQWFAPPHRGLLQFVEQDTLVHIDAASEQHPIPINYRYGR